MVVNGKVRFWVCSSDRQSKVKVWFGISLGGDINE